MPKFCFALDLKDDPTLIAEYEEYHKEVWPEIKKSIQEAGVEQMEIYRWENRLFMVMEVSEEFSFEQKESMDAANPKVQEWENLMWKYQKALPGTKEGEKWQQMKKIFAL
ncbi:L-rhamnose mutarotase [Pontibacter korlensis]|uniref:L-fucose mutarotase n=1 Tax=Pontibacter korlensis TaxID=400092 RepID=A0A0E3ZD99_9BACT|nr:L-rhamnose mutarotase [Pontibacter korlensis]AKD02285.1 L-fucose mutarotase [Pontibacter korlensis]